MTYWDMWSLALTRARIVDPVHWLDVTEGMTWLSEARHELQKATNALRKSYAITLDPNSTDGSYAYPNDYKESMDARYQADTNLDFTPVVRCSYDWYENYIHQANNNVLVLGLETYPQNGARLYLAEAYGKFWLYPYAGATGTLTVRYMPFCVPYSIGDSTNWSGYGADPTTAMKANGPEREFTDAIMGMVDYCYAQILLKKPFRTASDAQLAADALMRFERSKNDVRRTNVDYSNLTPPPILMGAVR
ncbi:hypothetical protein KGP36_01610 [Patescibacteria group bacterium]|nr:hypothetical protein [Patescibacteria group bacterium]